MGIEFIIPTYNRTEHLFTIVCSILAQSNPNWKIHIVGDNIPQNNLDRLNSFLNVINDDRIRFTNLPERTNDWGHTPRNYGLEHATEEWIVMTGEDNYYAPVFVEYFLKEGEVDETIFMYSNMVHNWTDHQYYPVSCELEYGKIDIGCYAFRKKYATNMKLDTTISHSDWTFAEKYMKINAPFGIAVKIDKILYVHN